MRDVEILAKLLRSIVRITAISSNHCGDIGTRVLSIKGHMAYAGRKQKYSQRLLYLLRLQESPNTRKRQNGAWEE